MIATTYASPLPAQHRYWIRFVPLTRDDGANRLIDHPAIISLCANLPLAAPVARRFGMERSLFAAYF